MEESIDHPPKSCNAFHYEPSGTETNIFSPVSTYTLFYFISQHLTKLKLDQNKQGLKRTLVNGTRQDIALFCPIK